MEQVKCECGHTNPYGTEVCASCGKPLTGDNKELLNMRYEGAARRSQTYNRSMIDKIWNFFSSVKVGISIIVILLFASAIGTIFPQELFIPPGEDAATFYYDEYGWAGELYYMLGFHNLYGSWWYMLLIAALGVSILIASIDRFFPLYKALKSQRVTRHHNFMKRQRVFGTSAVEDADETMNKAKGLLKKKRYNIFEENGNILAEKSRWARWGPYVNHIGLIIFLVGAMLRFFPGMYIDENMWVREGETVPIPGTSEEYYLENKQFDLELYDEADERFQGVMEGSDAEHIETFRTHSSLYLAQEDTTVGAERELDLLSEDEIEVNQPLYFDSYSIYQLDYKLNELKAMTFDVEDQESGEAAGTFTVDLNNPEDYYELDNGDQVYIYDYFANFMINDEGVPTTENNVPDNPAFIFQTENDAGEEELTFIRIQRNFEIRDEEDDPHQYAFSFAGIDTNHVTGLKVRKDLTLPFLIVGGSIFLIGLVQGSYWPHRRIWLQRDADQNIMIAAHTNKNWESIKKEIRELAQETELEEPLDQTDKEYEEEYEERDRL
ncbi:cytochrome c-type biogenesis protein Ccs1/ResB [Geomicrobium sp. JCM 19037]|nr:cytochrome c-type biogenesis protein Ccs1/ResB [Geomicrobium sp. JCM 19037]